MASKVKQRVENKTPRLANALNLAGRVLPQALDRKIFGFLTLEDMLPMRESTPSCRDTVDAFVKQASYLPLAETTFDQDCNTSQYNLLQRARKLQILRSGNLAEDVELKAEFEPLLAAVIRNNSSSLRELELNWILPLHVIMAVAACSHLEDLTLHSPQARTLKEKTSLTAALVKIASCAKNLTSLHLVNFSHKCVHGMLQAGTHKHAETHFIVLLQA